MLKGTSYASNNIEDTLVGDLISHVSGSFPLNKDADRTLFPEVIFFDQNSNLFISVEGLGQGNLKHISKPQFFNEKLISLQTPSYPEDSLSTLTSIVTGTDFSNHGIIGHSWESPIGPVQAYSSNGDCQVPKLTDLLTNSRGDMNILSVSSDFQLAAALAPHHELNKKYNFAYYVSEKGLQNLYTNEVVFTTKDIKTNVADLTTKGFNMKNIEDFHFASEIFIIRNVFSLLPQENRNAFISISFASIKDLAIRYGSSSKQLKSALQILDSELAELQQNLNKQFPTVTTEIVGLKSSTLEHTTKTQARQLRSTLNNDNETEYTLNEVMSFQTSIWTAFFLTIIMIVVLTFMCKMEGAENTIIYKTTDGPRPIPDVEFPEY